MSPKAFKKFTTTLLLLLIAATLCTLTAVSWALIEVKDPLSKMYSAESQAVYAGTISEFDAETHVITVKPFTAYKGAPIDADTLRIQIKAPEALGSEVRVGKPIVLFQGARSVAFHVADHWYAGEQMSKPGLFIINTRIGRPAHTPHDESFPGTTAQLLKALDEIKAGKSTLLNTFPEKIFPAPAKLTYTLPPNAASFTVVRFPGAEHPTFLVVTDAGLKALALGAGNKLDDETQTLGLGGLNPKRVVAGTAKGLPVLLLDNDLYTFSLEKATFKKNAAIKMPPGKILAVAIDETLHESEADIPTLAVLTDKDLFRFPLSLPLETTPAASAPSTAPAKSAPTLDDGERLTGTDLTSYHKEHIHGFGEAASMAAVDLNDDRRPDLIILTPTGTLTLLNRGFGGYLVNKDQAAPLLDPASTGKPSLPLLAARDDTLYLLQKDGTLFRYSFPAK